MIVARNMQMRNGEIDLLVSFGGEKAAVEVKSRIGDPSYAFTDAKALQVGALAAALDPPVFRVDLVTVELRTWDVLVRWIPRVD